MTFPTAAAMTTRRSSFGGRWAAGIAPSPVTVCSASFALLVRHRMLHGRSLCLSRPLYDKLLAWQRRRQGRGQLKFEANEVPEASAPAVRQYELIEEEERASVWEHLTGQELCDLTMPARCGGQNLETTPRVRDAGDFPAVPEERGPVVIRPQHFQGLAVGGAMTRQGDSAIGSHGFSFAPRSGSRASTRSGHPRTGNGPAHGSTRWPSGGERSQGALYSVGDRVGRRLSRDPVQGHRRPFCQGEPHRQPDSAPRTRRLSRPYIHFLTSKLYSYIKGET